jgi:hypothetical protein
MGYKGCMGQFRQLYDMIFARRYLTEWPKSLRSERRAEPKLKGKRKKISFFDPTPEESWEWWKYDQSW